MGWDVLNLENSPQNKNFKITRPLQKGKQKKETQREWEHTQFMTFLETTDYKTELRLGFQVGIAK